MLPDLGCIYSHFNTTIYDFQIARQQPYMTQEPLNSVDLAKQIHENKEMNTQLQLPPWPDGDDQTVDRYQTDALHCRRFSAPLQLHSQLILHMSSVPAAMGLDRPVSDEQ